MLARTPPCGLVVCVASNGPLEPAGVQQPAGSGRPGQDDGGLRHRRQGLVGADDDGVRAGDEGVRRQGRVQPEVRAPGRVDDERHAGGVRRVGERRDVAGRAHVGGVPEQDGDRAGGAGQRLLDGVRGHGARQAAGGVDRADAPRPAAGPASTRPSSIERCRVRPTTTSSPGRPTARASAWLPCVEPPTEKRHQSAPQKRAARSSASASTPRGQLHRVEAPVQRHVTGDDVADQVAALLVARDGEGPDVAGGGALGERQPGVEERCVAPQGQGIVQAPDQSGSLPPAASADLP